MRQRGAAGRQHGLGTLILSPNQEYSDYLYRLFVSQGDLEVYKVINEYPPLHQLVRLLNAYQPDLIFLEMGKDQTGLRVARDIRAASQSVVVIGFGEEVEQSQSRETKQAGVADLLRIPLSEETLKQAVERALAIEGTHAHDNVIAFLPAKAGSGATTAALNTAASLAHDWDKKVLILEADLHSGLLPVLVKLNPKYSIVDALGLSDSLDERAWEQLVTKAQGLDLLPTPIAKTKAQFSPWDYHRLLAFASHRYDFVVVDLPEVVNDATEAIVTRASRVHIVCTSEDSSLFLARRRIFELEARMVRDERLRVVLNRHQSGESVEEIEELLGRKLAGTLPNDYANVKAASIEGRRLDPGCALGHAYRRFAAELAGIELLPGPEETAGQQSASGRSSSEESSSLVTTMLEELRKKVNKVRSEDAVKPPAR